MRNSPIPLNIIEPTFDIHSSLSSCASSTSSTSFSSSLSKSSLLLFTHQQHQQRQQQENFILATSAANQLQQHAGSLDTFALPSNDKSSRDAAAGETSNQLCSDQKGFLDHLKPRSLFISTLRVSTLQISQILTSYVTDQIHHESSLDKELEDGKISVSELDLQKLQWEEIEWSKRWKTFPHKLRIALIKYHALVLTMRFYEYMIGKCVKDGRFLLDRLTKDSFKVAIVKSRRLEEPSFILREKSSEKSYALEMFETCIYSNAISFLADYSIQQGILIYGYYLYVKNVQRKNKLQRLRLQRQLEEDEQKEEEIEDDDDEEEHQQKQNQSELNVSTDFPSHDIVPRHYQSGGLLLSFMYKSSQLLVSRAIGLFMAGVGGALGSLIRPGWGTVVGAQLGDACVGALLDNH